MIHKHPRRDGHRAYDQPFETTAHTAIPCGRQPAVPMYSNVTAILAKRQGAAKYPVGTTWVQTAGSADVEPGIVSDDVQFTANPVSYLNPLVCGYMSAAPRPA